MSLCFRNVHAGLLHPVKGFSSCVLDLVLQRVSGFAHTLGYSACALIQLPLDAVTVFANPLVLEVGRLECTRNRGTELVGISAITPAVREHMRARRNR